MDGILERTTLVLQHDKYAWLRDIFEFAEWSKWTWHLAFAPFLVPHRSSVCSLLSTILRRQFMMFMFQKLVMSPELSRELTDPKGRNTSEVKQHSYISPQVLPKSLDAAILSFLFRFPYWTGLTHRCVTKTLLPNWHFNKTAALSRCPESLTSKACFTSWNLGINIAILISTRPCLPPAKSPAWHSHLQI